MSSYYRAFNLVDETALHVFPWMPERSPEEWWALLDWCRLHGMDPHTMPRMQVIYRDVGRCRVEYDEFVKIDGDLVQDLREPSGVQIRRVCAQGETPPMPFPDVILRHLDTTQETA